MSSIWQVKKPSIVALRHAVQHSLKPFGCLMSQCMMYNIFAVNIFFGFHLTFYVCILLTVFFVCTRYICMHTAHN